MTNETNVEQIKEAKLAANEFCKTTTVTTLYDAFISGYMKKAALTRQGDETAQGEEHPIYYNNNGEAVPITHDISDKEWGKGITKYGFPNAFCYMGFNKEQAAWHRRNTEDWRKMLNERIERIKSLSELVAKWQGKFRIVKHENNQIRKYLTSRTAEQKGEGELVIDDFRFYKNAADVLLERKGQLEGDIEALQSRITALEAENKRLRERERQVAVDAISWARSIIVDHNNPAPIIKHLNDCELDYLNVKFPPAQTDNDKKEVV
jgi:hypothetical protein